MTPLPAFAATGFVLALAMPAAAATSTVAYGDLDFSKPADVAAFNTRIDAAAKQVCVGLNTVQLDGARRVTCRNLVKERVLGQLPEARRLALTAPKPALVQLAGR